MSQQVAMELDEEVYYVSAAFPGQQSHGPKNAFPLSDRHWVQEVSDKFEVFPNLANGQVFWERELRHLGGRCFYYRNGSWQIGLSRLRRR